MKNRIPLLFASLSLMFVFGMSLMAQEKTEVTVKVKKNGKVVKDTTYQFEDEAEANFALQMMEHHNSTMAHSGEGHSKTMVFISEDGKKTEIKHLDGDSLVWISEDDHPHGEHVVVVKSGDGETFDILIDEDEDGKTVVKKEVTVIVSGDEDGSWTVESDELHEGHKNVFISDDDENVYVIKGDGDDIHVEIEEIMKEHGDGENVKVIVIKNDGDHDKDHDHDEDHDEDEVEVDVEVKVIEEKK